VTVHVCAGFVTPEDTLKQFWAWHPKQGRQQMAKSEIDNRKSNIRPYSHSMVAGGLLEMS
jgi:hypothetical protein